ncbi:carboxylating nicotinate-nucleotide diphosphorylase [Nannocystis sp.]|uniref:carboxylating nicotinate-nucleotide diphosphorylase n=1 Tax=Nannocystis sp. TaxID=1962667 RepID=UPI0025D73855|nr:carboxylating nicotinate-nucleotide diphosphorylase [Nannocystis sp.]
MESTLTFSEIGPVDGIINAALAEDLASGDVTGRVTVSAHTRWSARLIAKQRLVVAGGAVARAVFHRVDPTVEASMLLRDGEVAAAGTVLLQLQGNARALLAAERTALNLLQRMCGVATLTRAYVDAAAGRCRIVDTRKTMPGLRALDRYAVRCGGGHNHRNDLGAGVLIKENHVRAAGGVAEAVARARVHAPHTLRIECEVTDLDELREALRAGADAVLLDNMDDEQVRAAVAIVDRKAVVEVSGGVSLERISQLAHLGIDVISVGKLTHSAPASDISLLFQRGDGSWG